MVPIFSHVTYAATTGSGLTYTIENGKAYITGYSAKLGKSVNIPSTISGKSVVEIKADAFKGNKKITTVTIPNTVTTIASRAFKDCTKLTKVTITGNSLKKINAKAFYNCSSLASFSMPNSVTSLGDSSFEDCKKLKTVKLSSGLTTIPVRCFFECTSLANITIPKGITSIQRSAFLGCKNLTKVTIEKGSKLIAIGAYCFSECTSLKNMKVEGTTAKQDLVLPDTVSEMGDMVFNETKFTTVVIPKRIRSLNTAIFQLCNSLEKIYYYGINELKIREGAFYSCKKLKVVYAQIDEISAYAFQNSTNLEKLYVTSDCNLTHSANNAFEGCKKLTAWSKKKIPEVTQAGAKKNGIDTTAPKVKVKYSKTSPTNGSVTVTIQSTDDHLLAPISGWEISAGYKALTKTFTSNVNTTVNVKDFVGNVTKTNVKISNIDKTAPTVNISGTTGNRWKNAPSIVTVKGTDGSGIESIAIQNITTKNGYTIKDGSDFMGGSGNQVVFKTGTATAKFQLPEYGQYKVTVVDKAGNTKTSNTFWNYIDMAKPSITNAQAKQTGEITATLKENGNSGIASAKLVGAGKTYTSPVDAKGNVKFNVATSGTYTLKVTDNAGNVESQSLPVTIQSDQAKDENASQGEEDTTPTPDHTLGEIIKPLDKIIIDETTAGNEEKEDKNEDTITKEEPKGDGTTQEVKVETNQDCQVDYDATNHTVVIKKYTGTADKIEIPETMQKEGITYRVTTIAKEAFKNTGVKKVEIPATIRKIEAGAFEDCQYLQRVVIKGKDTAIEEKAFTTNQRGIKIYAPVGSTAETFAKNNQIPNGIYLEDDNYEYIVEEQTFEKVTTTTTEGESKVTEEGEDIDTTKDDVKVEDTKEVVAQIIKYKGNSESLLLPSTVGEYKVSVIDEEAFANRTTLKQIELPENIRKVNASAFENDTNLSKVILRNKKISIGTNAFKNCNQAVFYCGYDSTGMDFAKANAKPYVLIHGAFIYQLNEATKTADVLSAYVGEGDPEYVTIEDTIEDYSLGTVKAGAFLNTKLKGVIVKNKTVPIESVQIEPGALEGVQVGTLYCYQGSTADQYLKANPQLGIKVAYLGENGEIQPEEVTAEEKELTIKVGEEDSILAKIYPSITTNKELNYKSNNEKVVTVDETGKIKGMAEGEATIDVTAKADNSKIIRIKIKVEYIKLTLHLNGGKLMLDGKSHENQIQVNVPYDYPVKNITHPTKEGYVFKGWYEKTTDDETKQEEDVYLEDSDAETITKDRTLEAGWQVGNSSSNTNGANTGNGSHMPNGTAGNQGGNSASDLAGLADKILPYAGIKMTGIVLLIVFTGMAIVSKIKMNKIPKI